MPDASTLAVFSLAALGLLIVPGPAVFYIVTRSIDGGRSAGFMSVLGVHCGSVVHVAAAVLGISALLASSAVAFNAVKYVGAAYLIYLGIRRLLGRGSEEITGESEPQTLKRVFVQGMVVNVLNPKTALFFFAFLPQFVDKAKGPVPLQMAIFGSLFIALGVLSDGAYALAASGAGDLLRKRPKIVSAQRYLSGGVYLTLGVTAALAGTKTTD